MKSPAYGTTGQLSDMTVQTGCMIRGITMIMTMIIQFIAPLQENFRRNLLWSDISPAPSSPGSTFFTGKYLLVKKTKIPASGILQVVRNYFEVMVPQVRPYSLESRTQVTHIYSIVLFTSSYYVPVGTYKTNSNINIIAVWLNVTAQRTLHTSPNSTLYYLPAYFQHPSPSSPRIIPGGV